MAQPRRTVLRRDHQQAHPAWGPPQRRCAALLRDGGHALRPIDLPLGPLHWSPDGTALLTTTLDKNTWQFTVHRYDVATGRLRHTPIALACDVCTAGWAADSRRYVVSLRGTDPQIPGGPAQYLNPDGTPGPLLGTGATGFVHGAGAYSPSRRYVILEPARPFDPGELTDDKLPRVYDLRARRVVSTVPTAHPLLGWYDNQHVVRLAATDDDVPDTIEVVHVRTGRVTRRVAAAGLPQAVSIQLAATAGLTPQPPPAASDHAATRKLTRDVATGGYSVVTEASVGINAHTAVSAFTHETAALVLVLAACLDHHYTDITIDGLASRTGQGIEESQEVDQPKTTPHGNGRSLSEFLTCCGTKSA